MFAARTTDIIYPSLIPQERRKGLSRHCAKLRAEAAFARLLDETPGLAADTPWPVVKRKVRAGLQSPSPTSFKRGRTMQTCPGLLWEVRGGGNGAGMVFPYPVVNQTSFKSIRLAHRQLKAYSWFSVARTRAAPQVHHLFFAVLNAAKSVSIHVTGVDRPAVRRGARGAPHGALARVPCRAGGAARNLKPQPRHAAAAAGGRGGGRERAGRRA